jgi:hypothetical protein
MVDEKHQFIVAAESFSKGQDSSLLKPMLEETAENYKSIGKSDNYIENKCVIADTGCFSEDNLTEAQKKMLTRSSPIRTSGNAMSVLKRKGVIFLMVKIPLFMMIFRMIQKKTSSSALQVRYFLLLTEQSGS